LDLALCYFFSPPTNNDDNNQHSFHPGLWRLFIVSCFSFFTIELQICIIRECSHTLHTHILIISLGDDCPANHLIPLFVANPPTRIYAHHIVATPFIVFQLYHCIEFQCTPLLKRQRVTQRCGSNVVNRNHQPCLTTCRMARGRIDRPSVNIAVSKAPNYPLTAQ
jgi:hypothetical protein